MLHYVHNIDLIKDIDKFDVILVGTSTINSLGNGFQKKIALNFPLVNEENKATPYGDPRKLGSVRVIPIQPIFCLCYINKGRRRPDLNPEYLDYSALEKCLELIEKNFIGKRIATTLIGCSRFDGEGNKERVREILEKYSNNIDLYIYDYEQLDFKEEEKKLYNELLEYLHTPLFDREKKLFYWTITYGELTPLPEDFENMTYRDLKQYIQQKKQSR